MRVQCAGKVVSDVAAGSVGLSCSSMFKFPVQFWATFWDTFNLPISQTCWLFRSLVTLWSVWTPARIKSQPKLVDSNRSWWCGSGEFSLRLANWKYNRLKQPDSIQFNCQLSIANYLIGSSKQLDSIQFNYKLGTVA